MKITEKQLIEAGCQFYDEKWHYPKDGYYMTSPEIELFGNKGLLFLQSRGGGNRLQFIVRIMEEIETIINALAI